jgi:amino acid transporter
MSDSGSPSQSQSQSQPQQKKAGAFDIRVVIALLIAIYGVALTVLGIIADPKEVAKAAGININLWGGIAMLVFAAAFVLWARLRPIVVPVEKEAEKMI